MTLADARDWVIVVFVPLWFLLKVISHVQHLVQLEHELEIEQTRMAAKNKQAFREAITEAIDNVNWDFIRRNFRN